MDLSEARRLVIRAGHELADSGLISRTWGNVSCRIDQDSFVITPSGRNYLTLAEEEIVLVQIPDLSYAGRVEPSSELRVHAAVYNLDPLAGFIIHTHQDYASIVSALGLPAIRLPKDSDLLGSEIRCAQYALPGTQELCDHTLTAFRHSEGNAVILEHHGAVCVGSDYEEAFQTAFQLEDACKNFLSSRNPLPSDSLTETVGRTFAGSRRDGGGFVLLTDDGEIPVPPKHIVPRYEKECGIYHELYRSHPKINCVCVCSAPAVVRLSLRRIKLKPYLDDFAQIVGTSIKPVPLSPKTISRALSHSSAVLLQGVGALCCGPSQNDAEAVAQICRKNCQAFWACLQSDAATPIRPIDAMKMRRNYLKKYSKKF